jgi:hypothetical protein
MTEQEQEARFVEIDGAYYRLAHVASVVPRPNASGVWVYFAAPVVHQASGEPTRRALVQGERADALIRWARRRLLRRGDE